MIKLIQKKPPSQYKRASILVAVLLSVQITLHCAKDIRFLPVFVPICGLLYILFCREYSDDSQEISISTSKKTTGVGKCWLFCFLAIMLGQIFYWSAFFPGGFNLDALNQWHQIHNVLPVSDWHSTLITFVYWLITRFSDSLAACVAVQLILFSSAAALLLCELYRQYISRKLAISIAALIALNPAIGRVNISLVKDVYFSIVVLLVYFFLFRFIESAGTILHSKFVILLFSILAASMILIRHNGGFMCAAILLPLLVHYKKHRAYLIRMILLSSLFVFLVKVPIHHILNVVPHPNVVGEAVGVPMAIMTNALVNDPGNIPAEVAEFLHTIEPDDSVWKENYVVGEWDSCKWTVGDNAEDGMLLADASLTKIMILTVKTIIACPNVSYQSIRENSRIVWQAIGSCNWLPYVFQEENPYGITYHPAPVMSSLESKFFSLFSKGPLCIYHWNTGLQISMLLLFLLRCVKNGSPAKCILIFPLLAYNVGTALIIAGPNYRYFYCNAVLFFPLMFYTFCENSRCQNQ